MPISFFSTKCNLNQGNLIGPRTVSRMFSKSTGLNVLIVISNKIRGTPVSSYPNATKICAYDKSLSDLRQNDSLGSPDLTVLSFPTFTRDAQYSYNSSLLLLALTYF